VVVIPAWRTDYRSWGGTLAAGHHVLRPASARDAAAALAARGTATALAVGCRRSYGDVALNPDGLLIDCQGLDRFVAFDRTSGLLECEAGVTLADILSVICQPEPGGGAWFLPVSPGTRYVTLGGAIANDVHGKNHHRFGTIGRHVAWIELARSDGGRVRCSPKSEGGLFRATIGGLGLTGVILRVGLQLRHVPGTALETEDIRFGALDEFFSLSASSDPDWEYTAAWIDCFASGPRLGRGIFSRARHAPGRAGRPPLTAPRFSVPVTLPIPLIGSGSVRGFNALYWRKLGPGGRRLATGPYEPVFYPLDAIGKWNRLYGPRGLRQFQCAVPREDAPEVVRELLRTIAASGDGSMLAVLKMFGDLPSPGLLSFPLPGATLALDFPNRGETTCRLLERLEEVTVAAGGRIYPAKDSMMSPESFHLGYPRFPEFLRFTDPGLSSAFARRIGLQQRLKAAA
jgi:FAD/FMN-containing dehydrogenase